jgi:hypothetical protein
VLVADALPNGKPPAKMTSERLESYARPYPSRGGGDTAGARRVHAAPFQVHVSIVFSAVDAEC